MFFLKKSGEGGGIKNPLIIYLHDYHDVWVPRATVVIMLLQQNYLHDDWG